LSASVEALGASGCRGVLWRLRGVALLPPAGCDRSDQWNSRTPSDLFYTSVLEDVEFGGALAANHSQDALRRSSQALEVVSLGDRRSSETSSPTR
jgi:hypothetical protein